MTHQYLAKLYPLATQPPSGQPVLGICLSGGGSRALSCALGQLSALNTMKLPDGQPILSPSQYISSVSGGSWASVLYTFLPQIINGVTVSDADFLIQPVAPQALTKSDPNDNTPGNVCFMGQYCMGSAPQQFSDPNIGVFLKALYDAGFFGSPSQWGWFWIAGIGEIVLKPFGLYTAAYNASGPFVQPGLMFSLSTDEVQNITKLNPYITASQFYLARAGRPALIVNTNLLEDRQLPSTAQVPVQATPIMTAVPGQSPDGTIQGGGGVESFAFTSTVNGAGTVGGTASVVVNRNYSLCDIAGCSSAFFASALLQYIDDGVDRIVDAFVNYLIDDLHWDTIAAEVVGELLKIGINVFVSSASDVIPIYNYWSESKVTHPSNKVLGFSDGGDFDNSGILGFLAQTQGNVKVIAFVNTETPLAGTPSDLTLDSSIGLLFGYGASGPGNLNDVQVFHDTNPLYPSGAYAAVQAGLYQASCGGGGSTLGTATAAFLQKGLVTVENTVANISAGREVDVLWVYNNPVSDWQSKINDHGITTDLSKSGQVGSTLWNFPNYSTFLQPYLSVEAVNMLAQLSAWNVNQLTTQITSLIND